MLSKEQIVQLNTNNVSVNTSHTKSVVTRLWKNATSEQKKQAVALGSYKNTKSFYPTQNMGKIAVRMVVVLAQVFNVDPFYIIGEKTQDNGYSDSALDSFLIKFNFSGFASANASRVPIIDNSLKELAGNIIGAAEMTEELNNLSEEDCILLLKALFTQSKLNDMSMMKLSLIKRILAY